MSEITAPGSRLPGKSTRELRAQAHALKPVVRIAGHGLSESVRREIERSLEAHELIKIHAAVDGRSERESLMDEICEALAASPVQIIGKMLVVFRPRREESKPAPTTPRKSAPTRRPVKGKTTPRPTGNSRAAGKERARRPARKTR